jgi:hypothetical protein
MKSFNYIVLILTVATALTVCVNQAFGRTLELPFHAGEKITFKVTWSHILAGEATIELLPLTDLNGKDSCHILFTARTSDFVDVFYKVRDRIESYADPDLNHSLMYIKSHQAKTHKDSKIDFDWVKKQAQYSRMGEGKRSSPIPIMPGTFDPLSVFYAFRLKDLVEKTDISIPVTDGKRMVLGKANVIKREVVEVCGEKYDTLLVEPEFGEIGGVFEKNGDAKIQIWVTADNRHIPVRIKSKIKVGSFLAELTSYEDGINSEGDVQ